MYDKFVINTVLVPKSCKTIAREKKMTDVSDFFFNFFLFVAECSIYLSSLQGLHNTRILSFFLGNCNTQHKESITSTLCVGKRWITHAKGRDGVNRGGEIFCVLDIY